jgi:hypothetical protein
MTYELQQLTNHIQRRIARRFDVNEIDVHVYFDASRERIIVIVRHDDNMTNVYIQQSCGDDDAYVFVDHNDVFDTAQFTIDLM